MSDIFVNKVAASGIITLDLQRYMPKEERATFDLKDHLFMGLILKEKDFREALKATDWTVYEGKAVAITCTADAIIPLWAYMLVTSYLQPVASFVYAGTEAELKKHLFLQNIGTINTAELDGQRVVVKGCGDAEIEAYAYTEITRRLRPVAKSIMYGEPCSTVPIFKKSKDKE
ncbi:MAG: DUF2480 family protein [Chitinophagaceae bacterium]